MKTKIVSKLPSIEVLTFRALVIRNKIEKCEGGIPEEFWCDRCKKLLNKIESLRQKIEDVELEALQPQAYEEMHKAESRVDQGRVDYYKKYSQPTPTYKYRCTQCGKVWINGVIFDKDKKLRCVYCAGIVEEIKPSRK